MYEAQLSLGQAIGAKMRNEQKAIPLFNGYADRKYTSKLARTVHIVPLFAAHI